MIQKKYILTSNTIKERLHNGSIHILYQIQATKDFGNIKSGDLGGWIESEDNLSQEGDCWIGSNARVFGNAKVFDTAKISCGIRVRNPAIICGDAIVKHSSDYMIFHDNWNDGEFFTWTKSNNMWRGDWYHFYGTGEELIKWAHKNYKENGWYIEQIVKFAEELSNHKKS